jgi:outer membrane translocation and assembly module TamA
LGAARRLSMDKAHLLLHLAVAIGVAAAGCASTPKNGYGVDALELRGVERFDPQAIKACLATREREGFGFTVGRQAEPECNLPPFDAPGMRVDFWRWPWTEWPAFNETAFDRDLDRIERWYRARGYYEAVVASVALKKDEPAHEIGIEIRVLEGQPVLVLRRDVKGLEGLPADLQASVHDAIALRVGEPFDERLYDDSKRRIVDTLREASYAKASIEGSAQVDPGQRLARIEYRVAPGPACRFGEIVVEGNRDMPGKPIRAAAALAPGQPFSLSALRDARFAIYRLGAFAGVEVEEHARSDSPVVDVVLRVVPARPFRFGVGVGVSSGGIFAQEDTATGSSFAQWDIHLLGRAEHSNFLGGMRRLRIEERPRLIFDEAFPKTGESSVGNLLTVELRQPAFVEARTTLVARMRWDLGPDPWGGKFLRHDLIAGVGPERYFFEGRLLLATSINFDLFLPEEEPAEEALFPDTKMFYFYHVARVDLRDDPRNTTRGSYFSLGLQHVGYFLPSDWDYFRITQDTRGYVPLFGGVVLALRGQIGFMHVTGSQIEIPRLTDTPTEQQSLQYTFRDNLAKYGPLRHRLRGGGYNNVRGYAPNTLGDAEIIDGRLLSGGLRQWAATAELRVPLTEDFGTVLFVDVGDVTRQNDYRFLYLQTSFGLGLRYRTIVGPLRLDAALAPAGLQVIGTDNRVRTNIPQSSWLGIDGALSFTIGEAF